jgi:predicted transcriptional regulator
MREDGMFNKRRSEIQIINDILSLSKKGVKKTEILYQNNMSYSQLQTYLKFLLDKQIIRENIIINEKGSSKRIYINTEKGNNLFEEIQKILQYFK